MQRREFSKKVLAGVSVAAGLTTLTNLPAFAQALQPVTLEENKNYWSVSPALPNNAPEGKVQVIEFFSYSCGYCYEFMPVFSAWAKNSAPKEAFFQRVPVSFRPVVEPHARIFYTLEALDRLDLHANAFEAVLIQRKQLISEKEITAFFKANGVDADKAMALYNSFGIQAKVQQANKIVNDYGIQGTPAIGIGGKYRLSGASPNNFPLAEMLIKKVLNPV